MHVAVRLLADGYEVIGLDNINDYYDVRLKQARLAHIEAQTSFVFINWILLTVMALKRFFLKSDPRLLSIWPLKQGCVIAWRIPTALLIAI